MDNIVMILIKACISCLRQIVFCHYGVSVVDIYYQDIKIILQVLFNI